jgi:hypothetical protein
MTVVTLVGDALTQLRTIRDGSVQECVTSPPYWGLRSYLPADHPAKAFEIGAEKDPEQYIANLVAVFREVRRTLTKDGTAWLNLGDSYNRSAKGSNGSRSTLSKQAFHAKRGANDERFRSRGLLSGLAAKQLLMIPERVAMALQADGWWLRSKVVWAKTNGMPSSVTDRPSTSYEHVFLLSKSARYFYDNRSVRLPLMPSSVERLSQVLDEQRGSNRANGNTRADRPMKAVRFGGTKYADGDRAAGQENAGNLGALRDAQRKADARAERDGASGGGIAALHAAEKRERERVGSEGRTYSGNEWRPSGSGL